MPVALFVEKHNGSYTSAVRELDQNELPDLDVLVDVHFSSLNYKDALAVTGKGKIIRGEYPFVPGIDLVGTVVESASPDLAEGDVVIGTGWGLGEKTWGGYAGFERVRSEWLVPLPAGLSMEHSMVVGTAGLTAALAVMALEEHDVSPEKGKVVVTGASGGAGSLAVALLAARGFDVVASTGSQQAHEYLSALGASEFLPREALGKGPERPMESARWAGAVDAVGGDTLAALLAETQTHGSVAAFGNAGGHTLNTSVFPFILRGVNLLGIDSNTCPAPRRRRAWEQMASFLDPETLDRIHEETVALDEVPDYSERLLVGNVRGRVVVDARG